MIYRVYNYPWAGRLGRIAKCCIYCGRDDHYFRFSSAGNSCLSPDCPRRKNKDAKPIPELEKELREESERKAREWCLVNNIDYDQTKKDLYEKYNGPPDQERPDPEKFVKWFDRFLIAQKIFCAILTLVSIELMIYQILVEKNNYMAFGFGCVTVAGFATCFCLWYCDWYYKGRHKS